MKRLFVIASLLPLAMPGCSRVDRTPLDPLHTQISEEGALRLTVTDSLGAPGLMFTLPDVQGQTHKVSVVARRYGSLCSTAVSGNVDIDDHKITLAIKYEERLAMCTQEVRHLMYRAEVLRLAPGEYDVVVVHDDGTNHTNGVIVTRHVTLT